MWHLVWGFSSWKCLVLDLRWLCRLGCFIRVGFNFELCLLLRVVFCWLLLFNLVADLNFGCSGFVDLVLLDFGFIAFGVFAVGWFVLWCLWFYYFTVCLLSLFVNWTLRLTCLLIAVIVLFVCCLVYLLLDWL